MRLIVTSWLVLVGLAVSSSGVIADPVQRSLISADAVWWMHLDMDRLKQTSVGQAVMGEMDKPEAQAKFAAFQAIFNFDPRHSLRACTLYGQGEKPADAVVLLRGTFDADRLLTLAKAGDAYASRSHRNHVIHSWIDRKRPAGAGGTANSFGVIHPGGFVVLGQSEGRISEALDVMDGLQGSLEGTDAFTQWAGSTDRAVLLGAARRFEGIASNPNAAFLKHSSQYSLAVGEEGGSLFAEMLLTTESEEMAAKVLAIGQGLKALASLKADDVNAVKLAQGISLAQSGSHVMITLRLASADVVQSMREAAAKGSAQR